MINTIITGSGHFLPKRIVKNSFFYEHDFFDEDGTRIDKDVKEIVGKFEEITEIVERRYIDDDLVNSDMAYLAAKLAIEDAGINQEELDYVIVAHNYGDISLGTNRVDIMPSISARVKHKLGIKNSQCRPYDMNFGCPGWLEGVILGHQFIQANLAKKILVVASETLSRILDPHDRSSMIFGDGAGAVVLEAKESSKKEGVIKHASASDNLEELGYLYNGPSFNADYNGPEPCIKMKGRKVYEYALRKVPVLAKQVIDDAGIDITEVNKVLLHQANAKMDHAMVERLFKLYGIKDVPHNIDPMTVQKFGNSSVATIPTMFDLIAKNKLEGHRFNPEDNIVLGSVGGGMNINAVVYKMPL